MGEVVDDLASEAGAFAARGRGTTRVARFAGGAVANGFRTPYGRGWVLVGDAGYTKGPITAPCMSDAFAELLGAIAGNRPAMDEFASMVAGALAPADFFAPDHLAEVLAAAPAAAG